MRDELFDERRELVTLLIVEQTAKVLVVGEARYWRDRLREEMADGEEEKFRPALIENLLAEILGQVRREGQRAKPGDERFDD